MKTYTISVTANDIKLGIRRDGKRCPIAESLKRMKIPFNMVGSSHIFKLGLEPAPLPTKAREFIEKFDEGKTTNPITFKITI